MNEKPNAYKKAHEANPPNVSGNQMTSNNKLLPREFIYKIYIENLGQIVDKGYFYISFGLIGIGIEFLGKCIRTKQNPVWETPNQGRQNFEAAITELMVNYKPYVGANSQYDFADNLRNGMAHAFRPKGKLELTFRKEAKEHGWEHGKINQLGRLVICCEDLYEDFRNACNQVIRRVENQEFPSGDKIYDGFIDT